MTCKNWFHNGIQGKIFLQCMKPYPRPQKILPKIYQNKTKMSKKIGSYWFNYKKSQVISTMCKLFEYHVWRKYSKFKDKTDLPIRMSTFSNIDKQFV